MQYLLMFIKQFKHNRKQFAIDYALINTSKINFITKVRQ